MRIEPGDFYLAVSASSRARQSISHQGLLQLKVCLPDVTTQRYLYDLGQKLLALRSAQLSSGHACTVSHPHEEPRWTSSCRARS